RVAMLKVSNFEHTVSDGPVLIGPQSALELEWRILNGAGSPVEIPSPDAVLRLRVSTGGIEIPVHTDWAQTMTVRSGSAAGPLVSDSQPVGLTMLADGSSLWVRGSTTQVGGAPLPPGDYVVQLDVHAVQQVAPSGARRTVGVDRGSPIHLHI